MTKERTELATRYNPSEFEQKWYETWDAAGYFTVDPKSSKPKYTVVIPPPNVTGRLHIGHALVNTLIDVMIRWKRMSGYEALFLPGTDHAGIATQMVVERELEKEGTSRVALGRDAFVERVWKWKDDHGNQIKEQLKRLGASCDWTREHFTLDEDLSRAVRHVFVRLHEDGLIYRDLAMVNWCPRCHTAISDLEVEYEDRDGRLWEINYPLSDGSGHLTVATTRPETMLGDTGLGVHPNDERYQKLIGKTAKLPLTDREIPIVADEVLVDMEFGTGVVKITPAHDKNDYEAGRRNELPQLKVIDEEGKMTEAAGKAYAGLTREDARRKVVADLETAGLLGPAKQHRHSVGFCSRCSTTIEPMISRQWFVKIDPLAKPALEAVRNGTISITPSSWNATYFNWMENIHDWCISRQLWWGHRIPAFYCECGHTMVAESDPATCETCGSSAIAQETDVLDTWFSSALWPFSTMGWPEDTDDFKAFYPTSTMITGFDILFFWVARMIMMGMRFTGEVPFTEIFLNGLVRDEQGQKMSKTKGNVIDPLDVSDRLGADAVRFTLTSLSSGRDIPLAENRMQGYAAFATKIWNAARFAMMNVDGSLSDATSNLDTANLDVVERWILSRCSAAAAEVNKSLDAFRFDEASNAIYQFFWHEFCDWYIEMSKPVLMGREGTAEDQERARQVLLTVLDESLRLLHPFMPFITEEIWQKLGPTDASIMIASYPEANSARTDTDAEELVTAMQTIITTVRNQRASRNLSNKDPITLYLSIDDPERRALVESNAYLIKELAKLSNVKIGEPAPEKAHRDVASGIEFAIELPDVEITGEMIAKIEKEIAGLEKELAGVDGRLGNPQFVEKAPSHVIEGAKTRRDRRSPVNAATESGGNGLLTTEIDVRSLAARLTTIRSIAYLPRVSSTNTLARRVVNECIENEIQIPEAIILAGEQTLGRGRAQRNWASPAGKGIWATTLHTVSTAQLSVLPLRVATIVATFLRETFGVDATIKWPNDVLVDGKKIAGILIEGRNRDDSVYVIIGTGINVLPSSELPDTAVALADVSRRDHVDTTSATIAFVEHLDRELGLHPESDAVIESWRKLAIHVKGDRISCTIGDRLIEGTWLDIDDDGRALIRRGDETIPISAGDLVMV